MPSDAAREQDARQDPDRREDGLDADRQNGVLDPDDPSKPSSPPKLTKRSWLGILKRSFKEFSDDNCTDWAAALTYYGIQALFPAVIVLVALVGLVSNGPKTVDTLLNVIKDLGAGSAVAALKGPITEVVNARKAAGFGLVFGLVGALWSASGYVGAFTRASNAIYEVEEGRPIWKLRPQQILVTLGALVAVAMVAAGLVVSGPVAQWIGDRLGIGHTAVTVWNIGKWPVLILIVTILISTLYWFAPNVRQPRFRWFTVGGAVALLTWIAASAAFGFYVSNFSSYNKTYGSLGAIIAFLVWLYISNCAILLGAEINAEMERGRELQAGQPAEDSLLLPLRDDRKLRKKQHA
ncbi:MAG: YihY/virulence factor BrkB family protein [Actinomycetia bacterium]|nr:YihY/virulence factor BrkB family protein [Actinomycetes bacterium]